MRLGESRIRREAITFFVAVLCGCSLQPSPDQDPTVQILAEQQWDGHALVADSGWLYWSADVGRDLFFEVLRVRADGTGTVEKVLDADATFLDVTNERLFYAGAEIGVVDTDGANQLTIAIDQNPFGLAIYEEHVYWTPTTLSSARRVTRTTFDGGNLEHIGEEGSLGGIVADGDGVYWLSAAGLSVWDRQSSVPVDVVSFSKFGNGMMPTHLAVNEAHVYWTVPGQEGELEGGIARVAKHGGDPEWLVKDDQNPTGIALDETHVYWCRRLQNRYSSDPNDHPGSIVRMSLDGGRVETVVSKQNRPVAIALDDATVYWVSGASGIVGSIPKATGEAE